MEILQTIALLCQINGYDALAAIKLQLECQQYYIKCLSADNLATYKSLSKCTQERKL